MRRLIIALTAAALLGTPALAIASPDLTVTTKNNRYEAKTTFIIQALRDPSDFSDASAHLVIHDGQKRAHDEWITLTDDGITDITDTSDTQSAETPYAWECGHTGRLIWTTTVDINGKRLKKTGTLNVTGRCKTRYKRILRTTARQYMLEYLVPSDQFAGGAKCAARSKVVRGRATKWICGAVWGDGIRACGTAWTIRLQERVEFGWIASSQMQDRRVRPFRCVPY